ncbi:hypothetical protein SISSUDRAFT_1032814 [Sistotremastrum suecicum HHB10207 ss-3]|uniref:Uncharacterized protein n=1 Tax=Sistotremastrum suecicum HHB10207 ss-3 TaxID=1314776 RepID=A0A166E306_9AGAM|nr:hypothetical protein SISSUDRAFT_1032814 [Sistotremastrum suecicum HHB10207 ss-3]
MVRMSALKLNPKVTCWHDEKRGVTRQIRRMEEIDERVDGQGLWPPASARSEDFGVEASRLLKLLHQVAQTGPSFYVLKVNVKWSVYLGGCGHSGRHCRSVNRAENPGVAAIRTRLTDVDRHWEEKQAVLSPLDQKGWSMEIQNALCCREMNIAPDDALLGPGVEAIKFASARYCTFLMNILGGYAYEVKTALAYTGTGRVINFKRGLVRG